MPQDGSPHAYFGELALGPPDNRAPERTGPCKRQRWRVAGGGLPGPPPPLVGIHFVAVVCGVWWVVDPPPPLFFPGG